MAGALAQPELAAESCCSAEHHGQLSCREWDPPQLLTCPVIVLGCYHRVVADDAPFGAHAALDPAGITRLWVKKVPDACVM